jgi:hypothetical protein
MGATPGRWKELFHGRPSLLFRELTLRLVDSPDVLDAVLSLAPLKPKALERRGDEE